MSQNFSLDESYRDDEPTEAGSNRAFGSTVGGILMAVAATKVFLAGTFLPIAWLIFVAGTVLLSLGTIAPSRLFALNKFWLKIRAAIGKVANPVILALLFFPRGHPYGACYANSWQTTIASGARPGLGHLLACARAVDKRVIEYEAAVLIGIQMGAL